MEQKAQSVGELIEILQKFNSEQSIAIATCDDTKVSSWEIEVREQTEGKLDFIWLTPGRQIE